MADFRQTSFYCVVLFLSPVYLFEPYLNRQVFGKAVVLKCILEINGLITLRCLWHRQKNKQYKLDCKEGFTGFGAPLRPLCRLIKVLRKL